jgi:hypothetical protein
LLIKSVCRPCGAGESCYGFYSNILRMRPSLLNFVTVVTVKNASIA